MNVVVVAYEIFGIMQKKMSLVLRHKMRTNLVPNGVQSWNKNISEGLTTTCNVLVTYKGDTSKFNSQVKNKVPVLTSGIILWKNNKELIFG